MSGVTIVIFILMTIGCIGILIAGAIDNWTWVAPFILGAICINTSVQIVEAFAIDTTTAEIYEEICQQEADLQGHTIRSVEDSTCLFYTSEGNIVEWSIYPVDRRVELDCTNPSTQTCGD